MMNLQTSVRDTHDETRFPVLSPKQMAWLQQYAKEICAEPGEELFRQGEPATGVYVLLDGEVRVNQKIGEEETTITAHHAGEFTGELSVLTGGACVATGKATEKTRLLCLPADEFKELMMTCDEMREIFLPAMAYRVRDVEGMTQQREKMMAMGKLAAGLAHEMNNPASAIRSAARQLKDVLKAQKALVLQCLGLDENQQASVSAFIQELIAHHKALELDPLTQSDREEEMGDWLDAHGFEDGWQMAATLVVSGVNVPKLEQLASSLPPAALVPVVQWLEGGLSSLCLVNTIDTSSARISNLIQAIKSYTYVDQAALQEIDVHDGLENTLTILEYKIRHGNVTVERDFDRSIPTLCAYGSELNQVWTNLLDNAIDALDGQPGPCKIGIRTHREDDHAVVEIVDNGPGIPETIQTRIFDAFFTTKEVGKGTGLGLDIAYRIVVRKHHGDISVDSHRGETRFTIRLPIKQPA